MQRSGIGSGFSGLICRVLCLAVAAVILAVGIFSDQAGARESKGPTALPRFPSVSPDGSEILFSAGGDLWLAAVDGGQARRMTSHRLDDLHSNWSPDGESIVFTSMRDGYMNLWRMNRNGSDLQQLTYSDRFFRNPDWALDAQGNELITFSALLEADVYKEERPYSISPAGGQHERLHQAFGSEPRLSPDGSRIIFTRGGYYHGWNRRGYKGPDAMNVWTYDTKNKSFQAVTQRDKDDGGARWINNESILFMSERDAGQVNLYRADLDNAESSISQMTHFTDHDVQHFDVSRDGSTAVLQGWDRLYVLDLQDPSAGPKPLSFWVGDDRGKSRTLKSIGSEVTESALSPDGMVMAYIAYGRVYIRHMDRHSPTMAVTPDTHARHRDLAWSPDGLALYFSSDSDGTSSIYKASVDVTREEIREGYAKSLTTQQIAERKKRTAEQQARPLTLLDFPPQRQAGPEGAEDGLDIDHTDHSQEEPGREDPFAPAQPADPGSPSDPEPFSEPQTLPYSGAEPVPDSGVQQPEDRQAKHDPSRWHDAVRFSVEPVVAQNFNDRDVSLSPDGARMAFRRGRGDLLVMDLESGRTTLLVQGWDQSIHWRWSPDGRYIAYAQNDMNNSSNIFIVPADGSTDPVNITRHPRNDLNPRWSADNRILTFLSDRQDQTYGLYRVSLDPMLENLSRRDLHHYYDQQRTEAQKRLPLPALLQEETVSGSGPEACNASNLELETAWRRVERITQPDTNQSQNEMTPGGNRYVFNDGEQELVAVNWDGSGRKRLGPAADVQHLDVTGSWVVYISGGRVAVADIDGGGTRHPYISDTLLIDWDKEALQKYRETARVIRQGFYRPDMKGLDWPALVDDYEELIAKTSTASEFSDVTNRLLGELSASHIGISNPGPGQDIRQPSGRLGIDCEPVTLEDGTRGYRVRKVIPGSPADREPMRLKPGDVITRIDMQDFKQQDSLLKRLRGKVDEEVIVAFRRPVDGTHIGYRALMTPVSYNEFARLRYDAFREKCRTKVSKISNGRLGYIHIQAMNQASLEEFQARLYASAQGKEGLIIDVRNNGGGSTTDRILTSIMATEHAYTVPAGADPDNTGHYPQDRLDAPRYTLPVNMLANHKSYSNSEILAHAFSSLNRGTLVGTQTYGGVISTGIYRLVDGATVRVPFRGWHLPDGTDMEHNGAVPDLKKEQRPQDEAAGRDRQLEAAAEDLMDRIRQN